MNTKCCWTYHGARRKWESSATALPVPRNSSPSPLLLFQPCPMHTWASALDRPHSPHVPSRDWIVCWFRDVAKHPLRIHRTLQTRFKPKWTSDPQSP